MKKLAKNGIVALSLFLIPSLSQASSGTEGASFLDIPVGAGPAAVGSAYTAMADDVYAPIWNPGGLGFLESTQLAAQHLSYLESVSYEYASFVHPLHKGRSIGASMQYLTTGNIPSTNNQGTSLGSFSSHYAAYSLAFGQVLSEQWSAGLTGKWIHAKIDDVSANAYATDLGALYRPLSNLTFGAVAANIGTKLTFLNEGDPLPMALRVASAYQPTRQWNVLAEGAYQKTGLVTGRLGLEWWPMGSVVLRAGYRTDTTRKVSPMAGLTTGVGIQVWGHELAYAWLPYGELGSTQYLSMVLRFGEAERARRNLIRYNALRKEQEVHWMGVGDPFHGHWEQPDNVQLMELLSEHSPELAMHSSDPKSPAPPASPDISREASDPAEAALYRNVDDHLSRRREQGAVTQ